MTYKSLKTTAIDIVNYEVQSISKVHATQYLEGCGKIASNATILKATSPSLENSDTKIDGLSVDNASK